MPSIRLTARTPLKPSPWVFHRFSDPTSEEFRATHASGLKGKSGVSDTAYLCEHKYEGEEMADSLDWTAKGAVTPVKDKGQGRFMLR